MSVPQSPDVPNSLVAGKNAGNFADFSRFLRKFVSKIPANAIVCERIPCAIEQGIFSRVQGISSVFWTGAGNLGKIDPRLGALQRRIIPANTKKDAATFGWRPSRRSNCFPAHVAASPYPNGWIPEDGRGRVRKRRGRELRSFILARRAGGRSGRSWSRAPASDRLHPRGDPPRSRLGRRRGSLCLRRAPGRSQRRPCGRSSP